MTCESGGGRKGREQGGGQKGDEREAGAGEIPVFEAEIEFCARHLGRGRGPPTFSRSTQLQLDVFGLPAGAGSDSAPAFYAVLGPPC